jgi:hypothetical protein
MICALLFLPKARQFFRGFGRGKEAALSEMPPTNYTLAVGGASTFCAFLRRSNSSSVTLAYFAVSEDTTLFLNLQILLRARA